MILFLFLVFALGAVLALWSMREYAEVERREEVKGEVKLEKPGEIILPKGQKRL